MSLSSFMWPKQRLSPEDCEKQAENFERACVTRSQRFKIWCRYPAAEQESRKAGGFCANPIWLQMKLPYHKQWLIPKLPQSFLDNQQSPILKSGCLENQIPSPNQLEFCFIMLTQDQEERKAVISEGNRNMPPSMNPVIIWKMDPPKNSGNFKHLCRLSGPAPA